MTRSTRRLLSLWIVPWLLQASAQASEQRLHVMLQGDSAEDMRSLVETHSGTLTHFLPIIDAVGAELSREQLDRILATDRVTRYIDDLSVNPETDEPPAAANCQVGGALQLDLRDKGFNWRLFNKGGAPVGLEKVTLSWPERFGRPGLAEA